MADIVLRFGKPSDLDGIFALYEAEGWTNFSKEKVTKMLATPLSIYLVLVDDEEIIGFARYMTDEVEMTFIGELIIAKNYRRQGLDRRLIEEISTRHSMTRLELVSEEDNFYKAVGFSFIGHDFRKR